MTAHADCELAGAHVSVHTTRQAQIFGWSESGSLAGESVLEILYEYDAGGIEGCRQILNRAPIEGHCGCQQTVHQLLRHVRVIPDVHGRSKSS